MKDLKECMFYEKLKENTVQCHLCPRHCMIAEGKRGNCKVRENQKGKLYSLVYAKPCAIAIDPIEKKPLYHFMPGSSVYSIGTAGCNLHCKFCQNWTTSQARPEDITPMTLTPKQLVEEAEYHGCHAIAYTYNEPIIFYEYALDCAKLAKKKGIKNIIVCNGFINQEPLKEWCKYIDAANIDLKAFTDKFYKQMTGAWIKPVLESIKILKKQGIWLEITNLMIPTLNDKPAEIKKMCKWIKENIGTTTPLHFTAFYPCFKLLDVPPTPKETLLKAKSIADKEGLKYVYVSNVPAEKESNTYCPKCRNLIIERGQFNITQNNISKGKCSCGYKADGIWE
ncbi:MAG: AmmeMemoRadiSam system radical SAM enzyme [Nanoarchaeota archaeon]|nr:AmmeMemoRadiSam system radical SAM enzyme [Nanoarchaeota archaeon]